MSHALTFKADVRGDRQPLPPSLEPCRDCTGEDKGMSAGGLRVSNHPSLSPPPGLLNPNSFPLPPSFLNPSLPSFLVVQSRWLHWAAAS